MAEAPYTVGDAICDVLKQHGVTHLFGYPGGAIMPFYDVLHRHTPELTHILTRHEQGAAFMAQGWARATRQIGVCCATSGPGATNLVTGIADAYMDSIPMLAITGQVFLPMIGKDAFQEVDMCGITLNITKHNFLVERTEDIVPMMEEAIAIATSGRPGPVHIDVPKDVMMSEHPREFFLPEINLKEADPMLKGFDPIDETLLDRVMEMIGKAKQPVLLLGQGIKHADAESLARTLVDKLGIPTVTTVMAKGVIDPNCEHYLGMLGMHGFYHSNMTVHNADLIVNIGSRFDDRIVGRYDTFAQNAEVIHVDIDPAELGKAVKTDLPIHSDAKLFIEAMLERSDLEQLPIEGWWKQIQDWKQEKQYEATTDSFSMRNCLAAIQELIAQDPDKYIVAVDVGQHQMWASLSCDVSSSTNWLCSGGSGTMGFALPAAIGAAFAQPDKTVICISGDGGVQMNLQELGVMQDHNLDVKLCILNNNYLGMVRQWQELVYDKNYSEVLITSPEYKKIADAYEIDGYLALQNEDIANIHNEAFSSRKPCMIEYRVEKEDNVFPMVPQGKHLGETITQSPSA